MCNTQTSSRPDRRLAAIISGIVSNEFDALRALKCLLLELWQQAALSLISLSACLTERTGTRSGVLDLWPQVGAPSKQEPPNGDYLSRVAVGFATSHLERCATRTHRASHGA
jgi:hypothetical protein